LDWRLATGDWRPATGDRRPATEGEKQRVIPSHQARDRGRPDRGL